MAAHILGKLHYEQHGKHAPVIHGNPYGHRMWVYRTAHFSTFAPSPSSAIASRG